MITQKFFEQISLSFPKLFAPYCSQMTSVFHEPSLYKLMQCGAKKIIFNL